MVFIKRHANDNTTVITQPFILYVVLVVWLLTIFKRTNLISFVSTSESTPFSFQIHDQIYPISNSHPVIIRFAPNPTKHIDEGIPNRPSAFAYLVFGPGGITVERIARPMEITAWRIARIQHGVQDKDSKRET
jgi:hypothetical protein